MTESWVRPGRVPNVDSDSALRLNVAHGRRIRVGGGRRPRAGIGLAIGLLMIALVATPSAVLAEEKATEVAKESGLGAAAAVSSLVYAPVKLIYATGGLMVGAVAWLFTAGDADVAEQILTRSLRGTYVITPEILLGEEPLEFVGHDGDGAASETDSISDEVDDSDYLDLGW
jgi:hypothetical protein